MLASGKLQRLEMSVGLFEKSVLFKVGYITLFFLKGNRGITSRPISGLIEKEVNGRENHWFFPKLPQLPEVSMMGRIKPLK